MYDHIIVPIDFDHDALVKQGLDVANRLLSDGGNITLVHVIDDIPGYVATSLPEGVIRNKTTASEAAITKLATAYGANCTGVVRNGNPSREIVTLAKKTDAGCIIMASHKPGLQDYFLGSTAARVVRHAKCAVHVVR